jgi:hypothetical protein
MRFTAICLVLIIITAIGIVTAADDPVPDGTIYGHVYDAQTKQPISQAWVYCQETKCQKQMTDSEGYYAIENCFSPSNTYVIECTKNGYPTAKNITQTDSSGKAKVNFNLGNTPNPSLIPSPNQVTSWEKTIDVSEDDNINEIKRTNDGGYIIAGNSDTNTRFRKLSVIKVDPLGNMQWNKELGEHSVNLGDYSIVQTNDGNYIIAAGTSSCNLADIWMIKIDANGNRLWEKTFCESEVNFCSEVQQTRDDGYIIAGRFISSIGNEANLRLIKTDASGNRIWDRTFDGAGFIAAFSIQQTNDDGYVITGSMRPKDAWNYYILLIKIDSYGNMQWNRTFGGVSADIGDSVMQTSDDGYTIAGIKYSTAHKSNGCLIKTDANGNELWERIFSMPGNMSRFVAQQTFDGGYILAGANHLIGADKMETLLIKTDADGHEIWERTFKDASCLSAEPTSDGGYIVMGTKNGDIWLKMTDSEGN